MNSNQAEVASRDCRVCNRRRIKCDRRIPTCAKCEGRGLTCSGYGVILKWDQGVASRGNLKGKALPVKKTGHSISALAVGPGSSSQEVVVASPRDLAYRVGGYASLQLGNVPMSIQLDCVQGFEEKRLIHHYDRVVAPNMAWADCPENPWRHIIIPLALQSPPLLNAVLAFAAKHINALALSNTDIDSTSVVPSRMSDKLQQRAMKLLAHEIGQFTTADVSSSNVNQIAHRNALLATMLVLCNVETVWPDSQVWQVHLNAARTVMTSHETVQSTQEHDSTSIFIEQELFIANTFASTTNFFNSPLSNALKLDRLSRPSSIFIEFLKLIEMVTTLERQALTQPSLLLDSGVSPSGIRKLFENARSRTLELGKTFQGSPTDYLHLSRTVNCFYHAGILYSYCALFKNSHIDSHQRAASKFELFHALGFAETNKPTFAQDLVWPLFIAGTEATSKEEQDMVVAKLQLAMKETGFSNCQHALEFLRALWDRWDVGGGQGDWLAFAREWTGTGRTFLVF